MKQSSQRTWAIYALTALMLLLAVVTGAFVAVWCGTLSFIFASSGIKGFVLLIILGFVAWRSATAARDAWDGLPSAPSGAIAALISFQVLIVLVQVDAFMTGQTSGISLLMALPHVIMVALIGFTFWISPHFNGHVIEYDLVPEDQLPQQSYNDADDDDELYLGGA